MQTLDTSAQKDHALYHEASIDTMRGIVSREDALSALREALRADVNGKHERRLLAPNASADIVEKLGRLIDSEMPVTVQNLLTLTTEIARHAPTDPSEYRRTRNAYAAEFTSHGSSFSFSVGRVPRIQIIGDIDLDPVKGGEVGEIFLRVHGTQAEVKQLVSELKLGDVWSLNTALSGGVPADKAIEEQFRFSQGPW
ncbi:MAG: hypothetical protein J5J00_14120 [Deltaproteobacteria bacterium]|nr:hypothetical protein [Deltaproteobacteria bacterium]